MKTLHKRQLLICIFLSGMMACSSEEEAVFRSGKAQFKPTPTLLTGKEGEKLNVSNQPPSEATSAQYFFKLESNSGVQICTGEVGLQIMTNFTVKFPEAKASCMGGAIKIDLASILNGSNSTGKMVAGLDHDGKVLTVESIMGSKFSPPRPVLLGPIIQDRSKFDGYEKSTEHTVVNSKGQKSNGTFTVKVFDVDATFKNDYVDKIDEVIHWEIRAKGFEGLKATDGLIFDRMTWWFSTRPIVIPKIIIEAELKDFIEDKQGLSSVVGKLRITLGLKSFKS